MSLKIEEFNTEGPLLIHGVRHYDNRGYFSEIYKETAFSELGIPRFVQDNLSFSKQGVFRGMHWQLPPYEQGKLVTCINGAILDFFVDVRQSSANFGSVFTATLNSENSTSLWVPAGFAHGFLVLSEEAMVQYKVTNYWSQQSERSFSPEYVVGNTIDNVLVSNKDKNSPKFENTPLQDFFP